MYCLDEDGPCKMVLPLLHVYVTMALATSKLTPVTIQVSMCCKRAVAVPPVTVTLTLAAGGKNTNMLLQVDFQHLPTVSMKQPDGRLAPPTVTSQ